MVEVENLRFNKILGDPNVTGLWITFSVATGYSSGSQRVVRRPSESVSQGTLEKCMFLGPTPDPLNRKLWGQMLVHTDSGKIPENENLPPQVEDKARPKKEAGCSSLVINKVY